MQSSSSAYSEHHFPSNAAQDDDEDAMMMDDNDDEGDQDRPNFPAISAVDASVGLVDYVCIISGIDCLAIREEKLNIAEFVVHPTDSHHCATSGSS
jgi:hypothetical protein